MTELQWENYRSPVSWYSLKYPANWSFEEDAECTSFYDDISGVGALQISAYNTDSGLLSTDALLEYLAQEAVDPTITRSRCLDGGDMATAAYTKDDMNVHIWVLSQGRHLLLITYTAGVTERSELATVENIVASLRLID
ncbi:MAG TPA: DUF3805 domain-containing protein [Pyrinomonadaceae bacterium]|nr:DUF3805 domain-containing protein [Pyrinomonadaceae bacterium]